MNLSTLVLASGNEGKLAELRQPLADLDIQVRPQKDWQLQSPPETGRTFVENALIKARFAAAETGHPSLADDSGLVVDALNGAPGIYSARYSGEGSDTANNRKLLQELQAVPADQRRAHFYCAMVLCRHPDDPAPLVATGQWWGWIADAPRGDEGFGYDPLFLTRPEGPTAAQLSREQKASISHRGQALTGIIAALKQTLSGRV